MTAIAPSTSSLLGRWRGARLAVRSLLRQQEFRLVVSHFALYTAPVLDLIRGRPLVVHFQGPWALEGRVEGANPLAAGAKLVVELSVYHRASRFIVLSTPFRQILHQRYGIPLNRINVVPPGIDVDQFEAQCSPVDARERLGWPLDRPIVLAVRRLMRRMGLEDLVAAMEAVRRSMPDALLLLGGRGPLAEELAVLVQERGLEQNVRLLGFIPDEDLPLAYSAADLSVVPSVRLEGFGLITIESLAAGTPVLVTPVGGLPEAVGPLAPQLVLPRPGSAALAEGIVGALSGSLPLPDRESCREYARAVHDWPVIARRVASIYAEAVT